MSLLERQKYISRKRGMPTDDLGQSSSTVTISGETVQLYTVASNGIVSVDAGSAAGTAVVGKFVYDNILNQLGDQEGQKTDTSVSFTSTAFTSEKALNGAAEDVAFNTLYDRVVALTAGMSNGDYSIDYTTGMIYGVKASTQATLTAATYKVAQGVSGGSSGLANSVDLIKIAGTAVKTGGTAGLLGVGITDGTNAVSIETVGADAGSNTNNALSVKARLVGFNGTTWDRLRTANTTASATLTGMLNTLPWGIYNATAPTKTDGQGGPIQTDSLGNTQINSYTAFFGEDAANNLFGTQNKPVAVSTYAWSIDRSTALEASSISKATAGVVRSVDGRIDSTAPSGPYYVQLLNSATLPPDGAVTTLLAPKKIQHITGTDSNFSIDCTMNGVYSSAGVVIVLSTTEYTKTLSGAYLSSSVYYI